MTYQITLFDIGISDQYDCHKCVWQQDHGECYPDKTLHRRYFYNKTDGRYCSDYCRGYAKAKLKGEPDD